MEALLLKRCCGINVVETFVVESSSWNLGCGIIAVDSVLWKLCCEICAMKSLSWNLFAGTFIVASLLWHLCCGNAVLKLLLWNLYCGTLCCGIFVVESVL